jgi:transmembrane sensor
VIDLGRKMAGAMRVEWNAARIDAAEVRLRVRRRRRTIARVAAAGTLAIAALVFATWTRTESPTPVVATQPVAQRTLTTAAAAKPAQTVETPKTTAPERPATPVSVAQTVKPRKPSVQVHAVEVAGWRELARDGEIDRAYVELSRPDAQPVRDIPDELLLAADVERLSHHPAEAVAPLRQLVREHADDSRAPLAAFTLGRVLLDDLGRSAEAADAFAAADKLAPAGPLAEDAVAREVESLARSGNSAGARRAAEQYVARFPDGRKLRSVRRLGGLE